MLYHNTLLIANPKVRAVPAKSLSENDRAVLTTLSDSAQPLSAYDILEKTRSPAMRAPTQVYRSLQKLEDQRLVHRIEALSAFIACTDCRGEEHRPGFVICRDCKSVREFEDKRIGRVAEEAAGPAFAIDFIALEIFGRCGACRSTAPR